MDSYVVRIYRRDPKDPQRMAGVVERAEVNGEQAFHDLGELMGILADSKGRSSNRKGRKVKMNSRSGEKGGRR